MFRNFMVLLQDSTITNKEISIALNKLNIRSFSTGCFISGNTEGSHSAGGK